MNSKHFILLFFALASTVATAQSSHFGISGGYGSSKATVSGSGLSVDSETANSIAIGLGGVSYFSNGHALDYGASYAASIDSDVDSDGAIGIGLGYRFYASESFFIRPGAGMSFFLDDQGDDFSNTAFTLSGGLGVHLSQNLIAIGGYGFQLNNAYTGPLDLKFKSNGFSIGLQYLFD